MKRLQGKARSDSSPRHHCLAQNKNSSSSANEENVFLQKLEEWVSSPGSRTNQRVPLWAYVK